MNGKYSILLFGNYDGTNIGDDCILLNVLNVFEKYANEIFIPSRCPKYITEKYNVDSIKLLSFQFISQFFHCNVFIVGGGGIFSKYIGPYAKFLPIFAILAKFCGKKVLYYNVGVYNTTPLLVKEFVKISMLFSDDISVRDKTSFNAIGYVGKIKNVRIRLDPGLTLKPLDESEAKKLLRHEGVKEDKFLVGLSLKYTMDEGTNSKIVSEVSKFIEWVIEDYNAEVVFFPFSFNQLRTIENDLEFAKEIRGALKSKNKNNFKIIKVFKYMPNEIKGMMGLMNIFIGMRFHSIIFAYSMKKPLIGVSYEEKCKDFLKSRQLPFIEVEHVEFDILKLLFLSNIIKDR